MTTKLTATSLIKEQWHIAVYWEH